MLNRIYNLFGNHMIQIIFNFIIKSYLNIKLIQVIEMSVSGIMKGVDDQATTLFQKRSTNNYGDKHKKGNITKE